jgi:hypothetical protein
MKKAILLIVLGLAAAFAAGQTAKPVWKGTVATENGIKVVKNPSEPLYGTFTFDLQEELSIGGDPEKAEAYFPKGAQLGIDDSGSLFVSDLGNGRIQIYDKTGRFLRPLGRKGQGPGEYSFPGKVMFDPEGNACVPNGRDIIVFGQDGIFRKKIPLGTSFSRFILGPGGTIIGTLQPSQAGDGPKFTLRLLGPDGKSPMTIAEARGEFDPGQKVLILHRYGSSFSFAALTAETFAWGFSEEYKITISGRDAKPRWMILKEEKPEPITAKEKAVNKESGMYAWMGTSGEPSQQEIKYPDHRPFFINILSDDAGRLYIVRFKPNLETSATTSIDVFSKEGIYLYRMSWSRFPAAIKGGALYEVRQDEETGETTIVRSRIKNWAAMKN